MGTDEGPQIFQRWRVLVAATAYSGLSRCEAYTCLLIISFRRGLEYCLLMGCREYRESSSRTRFHVGEYREGDISYLRPVFLENPLSSWQMLLQQLAEKEMRHTHVKTGLSRHSKETLWVVPGLLVLLDGWSNLVNIT